MKDKYGNYAWDIERHIAKNRRKAMSCTQCNSFSCIGDVCRTLGKLSLTEREENRIMLIRRLITKLEEHYPCDENVQLLSKLLPVIK